MQVIAAPQPARPTGSLLGGAVFGSACVAFGIAVAYLTVSTPMASRLALSSGGSSSAGVMLAIWSFALVVGGALVVAGTDRLARVLSRARRGASRLTPVLRVLRDLPDDVVVATGVVPHEGRPIPELVVGPFGVAVVHEMPVHETLRRMGESWEARTAEGWRPTEDPLERLARDGERVRAWLGRGDLDFVVRVHAALVTADATVARTPACAVISEAQIPAWLVALPQQRSLSPGRRSRILAMIRDAVDPVDRRDAHKTDRHVGTDW